MTWKERYLDWLAVAALAAGCALRWWLAGQTFLELDEAFHLRLSAAPWPQVWREALGSTHPPLLILLLHWLSEVGTSEVLLRAPAVIAGTLFPWFVYRWTTMVWDGAAGFVALVILTFAPMLAHLSAVVRAYTMALLFTSLALWCLEKALQSSAPADTAGQTKDPGAAVRWMAGFGFALWLAVMSEFATAFFWGAAGCYVLIRWREMNAGARAAWVLTQAACLATYAYLLIAQVLPLRASHQNLVTDAGSYMAGRFPQAGENPLTFAARGTWAQFDLVFLSPLLAWVGLGLFALGLALVARRRRWDLLTLLTVPFLLTCVAAFAGTYPYGRGRQTIFLAMFISVGVGIAVSAQRPARNRAIKTPADTGSAEAALYADSVKSRRARSEALPVLAALAFVPIWLSLAELPPGVERPGQSREMMREMTAFIRTNLPADSRILVEGSMHMVLLHYLGGEEWPGQWQGSAVRLGGYWLWGPPGEWDGMMELEHALSEYRTKGGIDPTEPVWVVDAGRSCALCLAAPDAAWRFADRAVIFSIKAADGR